MSFDEGFQSGVLLNNKKTYSAFAVFVILLVFISTGHNLFAQTLLWNDEFDGTSLDLSKWEVFDEVDWSTGGETSWFAPHNIEVSGGTLKLYNQEESYKGGQWTGAHIDATEHPQYKYLEARIRHSAANTHIWATWWTVGWTGSPRPRNGNPIRLCSACQEKSEILRRFRISGDCRFKLESE